VSLNVCPKLINFQPHQ